MSIAFIFSKTQFDKLPNWLRIALQAIFELGLPAIPALFVSAVMAPPGSPSANFSTWYLTFGWGMAALFRINKQFRQERGLRDIDGGLASVARRMEAAASDIMGYATGSGSKAQLDLWPMGDQDQFVMKVGVEGKYPLYDLDGSADLRGAGNIPTHYATQISRASLIPGDHEVFGVFPIPKTGLSHYMVRVRTRNSRVSFNIVATRVGGKARFAVRRADADSVTYEIPSDFPGATFEKRDSLFEQR